MLVQLAGVLCDKWLVVPGSSANRSSLLLLCNVSFGHSLPKGIDFWSVPAMTEIGMWLVTTFL
jgi:hypothetical protein